MRNDLKIAAALALNSPSSLLVNGTVLNVLEFYNVSSGRWALVDLKGDGRKDGYVREIHRSGLIMTGAGVLSENSIRSRFA
jgi:hypothetical protein